MVKLYACTNCSICNFPHGVLFVKLKSILQESLWRYSSCKLFLCISHFFTDTSLCFQYCKGIRPLLSTISLFHTTAFSLSENTRELSTVFSLSFEDTCDGRLLRTAYRLLFYSLGNIITVATQFSPFCQVSLTFVTTLHFLQDTPICWSPVFVSSQHLWWVSLNETRFVLRELFVKCSL